jgi:hypothetical protein
MVSNRGDGARRAGCSAWLTALGMPTATVLPTLVPRYEDLPPTHSSDTRDTTLTNSLSQTHTSLLNPLPRSFKLIHVRHGRICFPHDGCPFLATFLTSRISCTPHARPPQQNSTPLFFEAVQHTMPLQKWGFEVSYTISYC